VAVIEFVVVVVEVDENPFYMYNTLTL